jgi:hypothetical protein
MSSVCFRLYSAYPTDAFLFSCWGHKSDVAELMVLHEVRTYIAHCCVGCSLHQEVFGLVLYRSVIR